MVTPQLNHPTLFRVFCTALLIAVVAVMPARAAKSTWQPVTPEELRDDTPVVEPGVFAEAIFYNIEIDDSAYPDVRRYRQYVRFKIYAPERAASILSTRLVEGGSSADEKKGLQLKAKMTLPNGTVTEFDEKSFVERARADVPKKGFWSWFRSRQDSVKDRMLIVSGVEKGAVLEYQLEWKQRLGEYPDLEQWALQFPDVPIRRAEYHQFNDDRWFISQTRLLNHSSNVTFNQQKGHVRVTAVNVPAFVAEPFLGPASDYTPMVVNYSNSLARASFQWMRLAGKRTEVKNAKGEKQTVIKGGGPWAAYASAWYDEEEARAKQTQQVKQLAATLTKDVVKEVEKAHRIHNYVVDLRQKYLKREKELALTQNDKPAKSPDEVIEYTKKTRTYSGLDFLMLSLALHRAAGLDAHIVLPADRTLMRFDTTIADPALLPAPGVGMEIDGRWYFSCPHMETPSPFNMLPSWNEGQTALVAREAKQEFVSVPLSPATSTQVNNRASFTLNENGDLFGTARTSFTGHIAMSIRRRLAIAGAEADQKKEVLEHISESMPSAAIEIKSISGLDDVDAPVEIVYTIKWDGYATSTKDILLVRPSVFRSAADAPFASTTRKYTISFPFKWQEHDDVNIQIPEGYKLEAPSRPSSNPGQLLDYRLDMGYAPARRILMLKRDFTSNIAEASVQTYPILKAWFDNVAGSDAHEVAFKKQSAAAAEAPKSTESVPTTEPAKAP
ncbi:MAG: hypothetical protein QM790_05855 [Nibricoccus sp.]